MERDFAYASHLLARGGVPQLGPLDAAFVRERQSRELSLVLDDLRLHGVRGLAAKALSAVGFRRLDLFARSAHSQMPRAGDVAVTQLAAGELPALLQWAPNADYERRMASGELCFAARIAGQAVAFAWLQLGFARIDYLAGELAVGQREAHLYDLRTSPAVRRRGLMRACLETAVGHTRDCGYERVLATAMPENVAGQRLLQSAGFKRIGRVGSIGRARRRHFSHPAD